MSVLRTKLICASAVTDETGIATLSLKIPGSFNGIDPYGQTPANGRFIRLIRIWSDAQLTGDRISGMKIEDTDQVMVGEGKIFPNIQEARKLLPNYPILTHFDDDDLEEVGGALKGVFLQTNQLQEFTPANPGSYDFVPSGCYIKATLTSGDSRAGKTFRANFILIKQE